MTKKANKEKIKEEINNKYRHVIKEVKDEYFKGIGKTKYMHDSQINMLNEMLEEKMVEISKDIVKEMKKHGFTEEELKAEAERPDINTK